ncbi:MAG: hypothetical protein U1C73_14880, partial [Dietzia sp.]|nr:hypothetical protein [Dietzia sp.]
ASAVIDLPASSAAVAKRSSSRILWQGLAGSYERLGFDVVADSVFRDLVRDVLRIAGFWRSDSASMSSG